MAEWKDYFKGMTGPSNEVTRISKMTGDQGTFTPLDYGYNPPDGVEIDTKFINRKSRYMNSTWGSYQGASGYKWTNQDGTTENLPFADYSACPCFPLDSNNNICLLTASEIAANSSTPKAIINNYTSKTTTYIAKIQLINENDTLTIDNTSYTLNDNTYEFGATHKCLLIEVVSKGGDGGDGDYYEAEWFPSNNSSVASGGGGGGGAYIRFAVQPTFSPVSITRGTSSTTVTVGQSNAQKSVVLNDGSKGGDGSAEYQNASGGTGGSGGSISPTDIKYDYFGDHSCVLYSSSGISGGNGGQEGNSDNFKGTTKPNGDAGTMGYKMLTANLVVEEVEDDDGNVSTQARTIAQTTATANNKTTLGPTATEGDYKLSARGGGGGPSWLGVSPTTVQTQAVLGAGGHGASRSDNTESDTGLGGYSAVLIHYLDREMFNS